MRKVLLLFCSMLILVIGVFAQTKTISGKITDPNGAGLAGVAISANGKPVGVTGSDGGFSVKVPTSTKSITLSSIGYADMDVTLGAGPVNVAMAVGESKSLQEVVVTGYQTLAKKQVTGPVATVKGDAIKNVPIGSFDQVLQGQVPGILIQANSGQPGAAANVLIRGVGSSSGSTAPLYIVDGVQISAANFSSINPADFETVNILKDASTTAQYGSRGANGVIVITTKKGKSGKTRFDYNGQYGQSRFPVNRLEVMQTGEKLDYEMANGNPFGWSTANLDSLRRINTNWQDAITQIGITNSHQLSASGGNDKTVFFASASIFNQTGTVRKTLLNRYSGRINVEHTNGNFKMGINTYVGWSDFRNTPEANTGINSPLNAIRWGNPYETPYNPDGSGKPLFFSGQPNPINELNERDFSSKETKIITNINMEYKIPAVKGLSIRTNWGVDYENWNNTTLVTRFSYTGTLQPGAAGLFTKASRYNARFTGTTSINYTKTFGDHTINGGIFNEYVRTNNTTYGFTGYGLSGNFQNGAGINAAITPSVNENVTFNSLMSYFAVASYSYKNRYFVNATVRRDGSSRFGANKRWANFATIGASWILSDEAFFKNVKGISNLKLRTSYGSVGNQEGIGNFASRELFGTRLYSNTIGPAITQLPNPDLSWEQRNKFNAGIDLGFVNNRINFNVDFYSEVTTNLLLGNQLSRTTGSTALTTNVGKMRNRGWEFTLITDNIRSRNFTWTTNINFTVNRNEVLELTPTTPLATGIPGTITITKVGYPINSNFLVKYVGVNSANGNSMYRRPDGTVTEVFSDNDRQIFGVRDAPFFGGFTNTFKYRTVDFSIFFTYMFGNMVYNNDRTNVEDPSYLFDNMGRAVSREWRKPGDLTDIPRATQVMQRRTTRFLEDGSFIRLRNLQLGYTLPQAVAKKVKISSARFYVMGENLWTGFKFLGFDPEMTGGGLTGAQYPALRTMTVGLQIGF